MRTNSTEEVLLPTSVYFSYLRGWRANGATCFCATTLFIHPLRNTWGNSDPVTIAVEVTVIQCSTSSYSSIIASVSPQNSRGAVRKIFNIILGWILQKLFPSECLWHNIVMPYAFSQSQSVHAKDEGILLQWNPTQRFKSFRFRHIFTRLSQQGGKKFSGLIIICMSFCLFYSKHVVS